MCQNQLEELRQKMGSSLSERYTSQQRGTAKIMSDHDKLRKELIKVRCVGHIELYDNVSVNTLT